MKIGILTHTPRFNYGGILQALALQMVLERMGHQVDILDINLKKSHLPLIMPLVWGKRLVLKLMKRYEYPIFIEARNRRARKSIIDFRKQKLKTFMTTSLAEIPHDKYDAIVVGSDQIWRKKYFCNMWQTEMPDAFLAFTHGWNIKRIAYAASFGVEEWQFDELETESIRHCLEGFNAISVREISAVDLLQKNVDCESFHVLDPTMLLLAEDYLVIAGNKARRPGGLVSYILDNDKETDKFVNSIAEAKGLIRTELKRQNINEPFLPIEDWIAGIASADLVVTNSFHGCVFSIIFCKPLIFIGNEDRGNARFSSLIETFNLSANHLADLSEFNPKNDYSLPEDISEQVIRMQARSIDFLIKSLHQ